MLPASGALSMPAILLWDHMCLMRVRSVLYSAGVSLELVDVIDGSLLPGQVRQGWFKGLAVHALASGV
jgi:hypothetical protein